METPKMKMMMVVLPRRKGDDFLTALINAGYTATYSETRGGMLRQSQLTLYIAVKEDHVKDVIGLIRSSCSMEARIHYGYGISEPVETNGQSGTTVPGQSGAVVFIWSLDRLEIP